MFPKKILPGQVINQIKRRNEITNFLSSFDVIYFLNSKASIKRIHTLYKSVPATRAITLTPESPGNPVYWSSHSTLPHQSRKEKEREFWFE